MFVELAEMLGEGDKLNIAILALKDGVLRLIVRPEGDFSKQPALGAGVTLRGKPEEFDADLASVLTRFVASRKSLIEQIDAQTLVLDAAKAAVVADTTKAVAQAQVGVKAAGQKASDAKALVKVTPATNSDEDDEGGESADVAPPAAPVAAVAAVELF